MNNQLNKQKVIAIQLATDASLYSLFVAAQFFQSNGAENVLIFIACFCAFCALITKATIDRCDLSVAENMLARKQFLNTYGKVTTTFEILVLVWFGWWGCAVVWTVSLIMDKASIKWLEERVESFAD